MQKMTDNEIIKALECCINAVSRENCEEMKCPALTKNGCRFYLRTDEDHENTIYIEILKDTLDLINRQKAEIERFQAERQIVKDNCDKALVVFEEAKQSYGFIFEDKKETDKANKHYEKPFLTYYRFNIERMIKSGYPIVED